MLIQSDFDAQPAKRGRMREGEVPAVTVYNVAHDGESKPAPRFGLIGTIASPNKRIQLRRRAARTIVLDDVLFDFDKSAIKPEAEVILDRLVSFLVENPGRQVNISGYTDSTGPESYNQGLSERRANAVRNYLIGAGQARGMNLVANITAEGFGESNPIASNATAEGRAQNRRAEIVVP